MQVFICRKLGLGVVAQSSDSLLCDVAFASWRTATEAGICTAILFSEFRGGYLALKQPSGLEHNSKVNGVNIMAMALS